MRLGCFTEEAYDRLLNDIEQNREKYSRSEDWLSEYFGSDSNYYKMSSVEVEDFEFEYLPGQKNQEDLKNTIALHTAFRNLTPNQASNKYLWTYLCHMVPKCREYIQKRWMEDAGPTTVEKRYFVTRPGDLLNDNALSRLWWYGHLTYDENDSNPYRLTEILLADQGVCTDVIDTLNRRSFNRIKGVLLAIDDFRKAIGRVGGIDKPYVRPCNIYLRRYAAVTKMEFLDSEEIRVLTFSKLMELWERAEGSIM